MELELYRSVVALVISFVLCSSVFFISGCSNLERKVFIKRVDFEVDPKANKGNPFVCNIVVPYSADLVQKLHGMDAQMYFTQLPELKRLYKDKMEIFSYDIIPGKSKIKQKVEPRSRTKAFGAYIFAKYTVNGKFAERLGLNKKIIVKFEEYKMTIYDGTLKNPQFDDKCAGKCPKKELPKTESKAKPKDKTKDECIECPQGSEYAMVCDDGSTEFYPKKNEKKSEPDKNKTQKEEKCIECPPGVEYMEECDDSTKKYYDSNNVECVECPDGNEYLQECDDGSIVYLPEPASLQPKGTVTKKRKTTNTDKISKNTKVKSTSKNTNKSTSLVSKKSQSIKR